MSYQCLLYVGVLVVSNRLATAEVVVKGVLKIVVFVQRQGGMLVSDKNNLARPHE